MTAPDPAQIFDLWESLPSLHPVDQALTMLVAASPDTTYHDLAELSIGARDRKLFELYALLFGPTLYGFENCPACGAPVEYAFNIETVFEFAEQAAQKPVSLPPDAFRLPNSHDLAALASCDSTADARRLLMKRCVLLADGSAGENAEGMSQVLADALAAADPFLDLSIELSCPACAHAWQRILDPVPFLRQQFAHRAQQQLHEVHSLALAYGWAEADILAMPPARRRFYVRLLDA